jgi:hypothetical protein
MHWWLLKIALGEKRARSQCTFTLVQADARRLETSGIASALKIGTSRHTDPPR